MKNAEQTPICRTCENLTAEKGGKTRIFFCCHPEAYTEIMPHRRIAKTRDAEIPTKTSPRWCPLRKKGGRDA